MYIYLCRYISGKRNCKVLCFNRRLLYIDSVYKFCNEWKWLKVPKLDLNKCNVMELVRDTSTVILMYQTMLVYIRSRYYQIYGKQYKTCNIKSIFI